MISLCAAASPSPRHALIDAAKGGDFAAMQVLLRRSNVNEVDTDGSTAILWATYYANADAVRALIHVGANVNSANRYGVTPLLQAASIGNSTILEELLKAGAKVQPKYKDGETALMQASGSGSLEAVKLLLARGGDVNDCEEAQHQTALMWASSAGHVDIVKALLAAGADPNLVARTNGLEAPSGIGGRAWLDHARGGLTALMFAAREGHDLVVLALLGAGAKVDVATVNGITPMMLAVLNDRLDTADLLLAHGANPNDGSMNELIQLRALHLDSTASDASRPRPQHVSNTSQLDYLAHLFDKGGDPKRPVSYTLNSDGTAFGSGIPQQTRDPAYIAALKTQDADALKVMISRHLADPDHAPGSANPPLIVSLSAPPPRNPLGAAPSPFRYPANRGSLAVAELLVGEGADVDRAGTEGDRPIHRAAMNGDAKVIQLLADHRAMLDVKNDAGLTPADLAAGKRSPAKLDPKAAFIPRPPTPYPQAVALINDILDKRKSEASPRAAKAGKSTSGGPPIAQVIRP